MDTANVRRRGEGTSAQHASKTSSRSKPTEQPPIISSNLDMNSKKKILYAIALPLVILLIVGGNMSLLTLCFGGLMCYILDLLGSTEGTLFMVLLTGLAFLSSLIYAFQAFLEESFWNFSIVIVMGLLLTFAFILIASFFDSVVAEFTSSAHTFEILILSSLPLISASLVTWFVCVEVPSLDIITCFTCTYFFYVLNLCHPRKVLKQVRGKRSSKNPVFDSTIIPLYVMKVVYFMPIPISTGMHMVVHHNVMSTSYTRIINLTMSAVLVSCLAVITAQRQIDYWAEDDRPMVSATLDRLKYSAMVVLGMCLKDHPVLAEVKSFSGLLEPAPSLLLLAAAALGYTAVQAHKGAKAAQVAAEDDELYNESFSSSTWSWQPTYTEILGCVMLCSVGAAVASLSVLLGLPTKVVPVCVVGALCLAEFYTQYTLGEWPGPSTLLLVLISALALAVASIAFTHSTVFFLRFDFTLPYWDSSYNMQTFCRMFSIMMALSIGIPTLVGGGGQATGRGTSLDSLPTMAMTGTIGRKPLYSLEGLMEVVADVRWGLFQVLLPVVVLVFASGEVLTREQNWQTSLDLSVETVYPTYYFFSTVILLLTTALCLYRGKAIGRASFWAVVAIQGCKLLHLLGLPSPVLASLLSLILTYGLPFACYLPATRTSDATTSASSALSASSSSNFPATPISAPSTTSALFPPLASPFSSSNPSSLHTVPLTPTTTYPSPSRSTPSGGVPQVSAPPPHTRVAGPSRLVLLLCITVAAKVTHSCRIHLSDYIASLVLGSASPSQGQAAYVALYLCYLSAVVNFFYSRAVVLRSFLVLSTIISTLLAYDAFDMLGLVVVDTSPSSLFYVSITFADPIAQRSKALETNQHSGAYLLMSAGMIIVAYLGIIPLTYTLPYLAYTLLFTFICTHAILSWSFPLSLGSGSNLITHDYNSFPFLFTFLYLLIAALLTLRSSTPPIGHSSNEESSSFNLVLASTLHLVACLIPFAGAVYVVAFELDEDHLRGVVWLAILLTAAVTVCTRMKELASDVETLKRTGSRPRREIQRRTSVETGITTMSCVLCIFWTVVETVIERHLNQDLRVPVSCGLLLFTRRGVFLEGSHPAAVAGLSASIWWVLSALYSIFLKGYFQEQPTIAGFQHSHYYNTWFPDQDVSIWTGPMWLTIWTFALMLIPLPGIIMGVRERSKQSEDVMLVLGVLSAIPVVVASINSVRYLGLVGCVLSSLRFYSIGKAQRASESLI